MKNKVNEAARLLGSLGGRRNTPAQQAARAQNGKRGGRPRRHNKPKAQAPAQNLGFGEPWNTPQI